jgi:futalosine hydrolase
VVGYGVAGTYPGSSLRVGDVCLVGDDQLADEGVAAEDGFHALPDLDLGLGLGEVGPFPADPEQTATVARALAVPIVSAATVSTCSATDDRAAALAARTGAGIETMEGAALALACRSFGIPWIQIRAISNRTGDRARGGWNLELALRNLADALRNLP